ncbi:MAG TPA: cytochrome c biogenesis protein CcsA [Symbiobacteriaceae bacterium]|jgi:ABC-type transport system involved in cytochrome c biogenesis permease subunit
MAWYLTLTVAAAAALYTLSATAHIFFLFRREFDTAARHSTRLAWAVHTLGLVLLVAHIHQVPVHTLFDFSYFFTWIMVTIYVTIEFLQKNQAAGSFLMPVIAVVQIVGTALPKPSPETLMLNQLSASLIAWHIAVTGLGYVHLFASAIAGGLYLLQERNLRKKNWGPLYYRLPSLEALDIWGGRLVYIGFTLLTIGMTAGLVFAQITWTRLWTADPKVAFTVFCWVVYGDYLLMRQVWGWGGRRSAWWSMAGALVLLINYFVMNMVSRLHRFVG